MCPFKFLPKESTLLTSHWSLTHGQWSTRPCICFAYWLKCSFLTEYLSSPYLTLHPDLNVTIWCATHLLIYLSDCLFLPDENFISWNRRVAKGKNNCWINEPWLSGRFFLWWALCARCGPCSVTIIIPNYIVVQVHFGEWRTWSQTSWLQISASASYYLLTSEKLFSVVCLSSTDKIGIFIAMKS